MIIYQALFPNGKSYIGKTKNLKKRKKDHLYNSIYKNSNNTKMKRATNKYGFDNITWNVLFETDNNLILNEEEKKFIKKYKSIENGYNITLGGDGGDTISNNYNKYEIIKTQLESKGYDNQYYVIITGELSLQIIDDYTRLQYSLRYLSKKYKISRQRIARFLKSKNIDIDINKSTLTNSIKLSENQVQSVIQQYKIGKTIKNISINDNLTIMIVSRILNDSGVRKSNRFKNGKRYDGKQPKKKD